MITLNFSSNQPQNEKPLLKSSLKTSQGVQITPEQGVRLLKSAKPLTLPCNDAEGRIIQLWKFKRFLVASIFTDNRIVIVSQRHITNPTQKDENSHQLLESLESKPLKKWSFTYCLKTGKVCIWPHMIAAGKDGQWNPPPFPNDKGGLGHIFTNKPGHFSEDTPENRSRIHQAVGHPSNWVYRDSFGKEYYVKTHPDGRQTWAYVRDGIVKKEFS